MKKVFKQRISPVLAFLLVLIFGYFSIYFMDRVFQKYASDEFLSETEQYLSSNR
ncbi:hypothetical protein KJ840_05560 [Patescibacteria group bacterium]|nr:hypothetical protein [Patescibacteria group bacterium]